MTRRSFRGVKAGVGFLYRTSRQGYDVETEPLGSSGISFDSRLTDIGTVVASGVIVCGAGKVYFPAMNYVPVAKISYWNGSDALPGDWIFRTQFTSFPNHFWIPAVAIVTNQSIEVAAFQNGMVSILPQFNPNGQTFLYSVFASG